MERPVLPASRQQLVLLVLFVFVIGCSDSDDVLDNVSLIHNAKVQAAGVNNMTQVFIARLSGDQERPLPVISDGTGQAIFRLSKDGQSITYKLIVNNLDGVTQAHIHCGGPEDAGPVVAFLFHLVPEGISANGVVAEGTLTQANVIARPDSQQCMGGVATFEELLAKMKTGSAYVNVHTLTYPAGEIRGKIVTRPE